MSEAFARRALPLLAVVALALLTALRLDAPGLRERGRRLPLLALAAVHAGWLWLFVDRILGLPIWVGFDALYHLEYVHTLYAEHRLPSAAEGWSTYHPPLFYALVAGLTELAHRVDGEELARVALKGLPFLCGLGQVWVAWGLARVLLPGRFGLHALAVLFAGALPLNLYMAAYPSNEPLQAVLLGAAMLVLAGALLRGPLGLGAALGAGLLLGLALLAKLTAVLGIAAAALTLLVAPGAPTTPRRAAVRLAALLTPVLLLSGWFYARSLFDYGQLVLGNWSLPGAEQAWWSHPGFHTPAYYLGFGAALVQPCFAGFESFADALYSTLWADGWIGGRESILLRPTAWDWEWMGIGCWLALPACVVLAVGALRMLRLAFCDDDAARAAAFWLQAVLAWLVGFALFALTVLLPFFGQARASYALCLMAPLAIAFAMGAEWIEDALVRLGGYPLRLAFRTWLGTLLPVLYLGFAG